MLTQPFSYESLSLRDTILDLGVRFILNCPPEDISTPSRLMFQVEEASWFYDDFAREQNPGLPSMSLPTFTKILYETIPIMTTICANYSDAIAEFKAYKKGIPVRGGIILNDKLNKVLMVRPWKRPIWGFPRGKINKEEDDRACAIREVEEETGFDMGPYLPESGEYCERTLGGKNYRLYLASGVPESTVFETRTRKEIDEIKWIPLGELKKKASAKNYFLVTPFANWILKMAKEKRGVATKLSKSQSHALKKVLGVASSAGSQAVHNDEESARQLLVMLKPSTKAYDSIPQYTAQYAAINNPTSQAQAGMTPVANSDRQVLLNLIQGSPANASQNIAKTTTPVNNATANAATTTNATTSTDSTAASASSTANAEVENAKHILALLKQEIATEKTVNAPQSINPQVASVESLTPNPDAPVLPPNSMLEQLVSSRKSSQTRRPSVKSPLKPEMPQHALLNVLKHSGYKRQTKLIDLLKPPKPVSEGSYMPSNNPLMDLLELTAKDQNQSPSKPTQGPEPDSSDLASKSDTSDKEPSVPPHPLAHSAPSSRGSGHTSSINDRKTSKSAGQSSSASNSLLSLLEPQPQASKVQTNSTVDTIPQRRQTDNNRSTDEPTEEPTEEPKDEPKDEPTDVPVIKANNKASNKNISTDYNTDVDSDSSTTDANTTTSISKLKTNKEASDSLLRLLDTTTAPKPANRLATSTNNKEKKPANNAPVNPPMDEKTKPSLTSLLEIQQPKRSQANGSGNIMRDSIGTGGQNALLDLLTQSENSNINKTNGTPDRTAGHMSTGEIKQATTTATTTPTTPNSAISSAGSKNEAVAAATAPAPAPLLLGPLKPNEKLHGGHKQDPKSQHAANSHREPMKSVNLPVSQQTSEILGSKSQALSNSNEINSLNSFQESFSPVSQALSHQQKPDYPNPVLALLGDPVSSKSPPSLSEKPSSAHPSVSSDGIEKPAKFSLMDLLGSQNPQ